MSFSALARLAQGLAALGQTQLACFRQRWEASSYPAFSPWAYSLDTLTTNARYSHEKAARELGYVVRPFDETVRDTIAWLRDEGLAA